MNNNKIRINKFTNISKLTARVTIIDVNAVNIITKKW